MFQTLNASDQLEIKHFYDDLEIISSEITKLAASFKEVNFQLGKLSLLNKSCLRDIVTNSAEEEYRGKTNSRTYLPLDTEEQVKLLYDEILLKVWKKKKGKFLEILCFLAKLQTLESVEFRKKLVDLSKPIDPISAQIQGQNVFIWYLTSTKQTVSGLTAKPDIVITNTSSRNLINKNTIISVVECKFREKFGITGIRQELGKAIDMGLNLAIQEYTIVTYNSPEKSLKIGAKKLQLSLVDFGLWSADRSNYLNGSKVLSMELVQKFEKASNQKVLSGTSA